MRNCAMGMAITAPSTNPPKKSINGMMEKGPARRRTASPFQWTPSRVAHAATACGGDGKRKDYAPVTAKPTPPLAASGIGMSA